MLSNAYIINRLKYIGYNFNGTQINEVIRRVHMLEQDSTWKNKSSQAYNTLIDRIASDYYDGFSWGNTYSDLSSLRHLNWFNTFLYNGAASDILNILNKYNIDPKILKGVKYGKFDKITRDTKLKNGNFELVLHYEELGSGSMRLEYADIKIDGQTVYHWKYGREDFKSIEDIDEEEEVYVQKQEKLNKEIDIEQSYQERFNKEVMNVASNPENPNEYIIKYMSSKGIRYRNQLGQRAKKSLYEEWSK